MEKKELLSIDDLVRGKWFLDNKPVRWVIRKLFQWLRVDRVNQTYLNCMDQYGPDFAKKCLNDLGVDYRVLNPQRLQELPQGAFITVSNHPFGSIDGIILVDLLGHIRQSYMVMVNQILMRIKSLATSFISVTPYTGKENQRSSVDGFIKTIRHLRDGNPMGFFPAGAVSFYNKTAFAEDREWQPTVIRLIKKAKVPVIPIFFHDQNSMLYYKIGHYLGWQIRTLFLLREVYNKRGQTIRISIGEEITPEEIAQYKDEKSLGKFLKQRTYACRINEESV